MLFNVVLFNVLLLNVVQVYVVAPIIIINNNTSKTELQFKFKLN